MSDSENEVLSETIPHHREIEQCLTRVVRDAVLSGEAITVNLARQRAEAELSLESGYLKSDTSWRKRSKETIAAAFESTDSPHKSKPASSAGAEASKASKTSTKRKLDRAPPARNGKRQKREQVVSDSHHDVDGASEESGRPKGTPTTQEGAESKEETKGETERSTLDLSNGTQAAVPTADMDDDCDLSSVIDDPPPKKSRQKKGDPRTATKPRAKATSKAPAAATVKDPLTAAEAQIKLLQSQLLKCGIRKLWHRELAPYPTSAAKVAHLRSLLAHSGITGRFSAEKARQIKEERELRQEIEAAREFNEQWGETKGEALETAGPVRRGRLAPKGLVDLGGSSDGGSE